jgi:hypothetical protein
MSVSTIPVEKEDILIFVIDYGFVEPGSESCGRDMLTLLI